MYNAEEDRNFPENYGKGRLKYKIVLCDKKRT